MPAKKPEADTSGTKTRLYEVYDAALMARAYVGSQVADKPATALDKVADEGNLTGHYLVIVHSAMHSLHTETVQKPSRYSKTVPRLTDEQLEHLDEVTEEPS